MTRVIKAQDAIRCCESGYIRNSIDVANLIAEYLSALIEEVESESEGLAFVAPGATIVGFLEQPSTVPRIVRIPVGTGLGASLGVGAVLLLSGSELASIARQTGALGSAEAILKMVVTMRTKTRAKESCEACVRGKVLDQDAPRRRELARRLVRI